MWPPWKAYGIQKLEFLYEYYTLWLMTILQISLQLEYDIEQEKMYTILEFEYLFLKNQSRP